MEKLTTAKMIEKLGLQDEAVNQDGFRVGYDHKGNLLMWDEGEKKPEDSESNKFIIYFPWVKRDVWVINYHFVGFEEAQMAHTKDKKTVVYYHDDKLQYRFVYGEYGHFKQLADDGIGLDEITEGNWIIEN